MNMAADKILDNTDLKKIRYLKLKKGVGKVDKGLMSEDDENEDDREEN